MAYPSRPPVSAAYALALGRATYNFACLEWAVKQAMERLRSGYVKRNENDTAGELAEAFLHAARKARLPDAAVEDLIDVAHRFRNLVPLRNNLLHAHPVTAASGEEVLARNRNGEYNEWERAEIDEAADAFAECARAAAEVQHKYLDGR